MTTDIAGQGQVCPHCGAPDRVVPKRILIGAASPDPELAGYQRREQLALDEILPDYVAAGPAPQCIAGCYCERCGIGFIPDHMISPSVLKSRRRK